MVKILKTTTSKIGYMVVMMFLISIISFLAIHAAPNTMLADGMLNPNMKPEIIAHQKELLGIGKPLFEQYTSWISSFLHFDFGFSFVTGNDVTTEILNRISITLFLNITSLLVVFSLALYLGIKSGLRPDSGFDKMVKQLSLVSFSMPSFYLAVLLVLFFSVYLEVTPIAGMHALGINEANSYTYYKDYAWHLVLPLFVMIFVSIGSMTMYVRSLVIEINKSDYILFAKARNISNTLIIRRYILPNLMPPVVTLLGLSLPGLIGGSVILEKIFAIDGMGLLFFNSALSRDYPVILGILIITAFLTLLGNVLADLILVKLNPFFKQAKG